MESIESFSSDISPCPNPECEKIECALIVDGNNSYVNCWNCGIRGPETSEEEAIRLWNLMKR